ncbi:phosphoribosyl-ATP diphosphatase [Rhizobium mongolense]|jgi:phosphoribosyl-ATP pyrophosphohydrolase|uniref:Phosphoribosyl-ATP pyrophosphatase n=2 Tax=Rhizobium mongolense TaxID=57676 RepID=A0ABR6IX23_9HYPH|nr:phosphoribosyl-ATP diphosphatase [Rhizobium mongolense]MBB4232457.1 phosphoribosyl-ATP pyrophosphohydrolase [Rhizobium mongolense]TVZ65812.1 phosphoribosyl-ATP pyrophosphatase [Rhizobium mongolense USDA 1844]
MTGFSLSDLEKIVDERSKAPPDESWTAKLVAAGQQKAAKKLGEEAIEAVMAAVAADRANLTYEAADLLYHLLVVLKIAGIPLQDVMAELERRTAQSGVKEKASRQSS